MEKLKRLPRIASIVAFVMAGLLIIAGIFGPIVLLPLALIPLASGVGILRRRVWSAYGFATVELAQILLLPVVLSEPGWSVAHMIRAVCSALFSLLAGILFLFAGRSLAASGATTGRAFPWIIVALLSVGPFFFVHPFEIPSMSMEGTLLRGDRILAVTLPIQLPERGKMVLFLSPQNPGAVLVKRVVAVAGDHIRIARRVVILNGVALDEKYAVHNLGGVDFYPDDFPNDTSLPGCEEGHELLSQHTVNGEIVVPAGAYFVLGDNRENSLDSRCWGFINSKDLRGRPWMIYDSIDGPAGQGADLNQGWIGHRRWARLFKVFS
jgi:signal peptidase I